MLYSVAYAYKEQLNKYFLPAFIQRLEAVPTWGGDKTTSCVRAHILSEGVELDIDLGESSLNLGVSDVLKDEVSVWTNSPVHFETKKVTQLMIHLSSEAGQIMVNDLYFPLKKI